MFKLKCYFYRRNKMSNLKLYSNGKVDFICDSIVIINKLKKVYEKI